MKKGLTPTLSHILITMAGKNPIWGNLTNGIIAGTTAYFAWGTPLAGIQSDPGADSSDPLGNLQPQAVVMPCPGTFKNLYVWFTQPPGIGHTFEVRLRLNGVATLLSCQFSGNPGPNPALVTNLVNTVNVVPGDLLCMEAISPALALNSLAFGYAFEFDPS